MDLIDACKDGHLAYVEAYLEEGGYTEEIDEEFQRNALMWSVWTANYECALALLPHTSDINAGDSEGKTVLMRLSSKWEQAKTHTATRAVEVMETLLMREDLELDQVDLDGWTALHWAALHGHLDAVTMLLHYGCNPDVPDCHWRSPLMIAANKGFRDIIEMLLEHDVPVDKVDFDGKSALMFAATSGHKGAVLELHKYGADINRVDDEQQSVLFLAATKSQAKCVKVLLKLGCDLQQVLKHGHEFITNLQDSEAGRYTITILLVAGCQPPRKKRELKDLQKIVSSVVENLYVDDMDLYDESVKEFQIPLIFQCRKQIRRHLQFSNTKGNLFNKVDELPSKKELKRLLLYYLD